MPRRGSRSDREDELRQKLRRVLLTAASSEVEDIVTDVLGRDVDVPDVSTLAQRLIGGTITNRALMYTEAAYSTYENNVVAREKDEGVTLGRRVLEAGDNCEDCIAAASEEFVPLDQLPEISDSICGPRCRCEFEFQVEGEQFVTSELFSARIAGQERFGGSVELE